MAFLTSASPVLFQNIKETKVFADGISEEVLNKLALLLEFIFRKFADGKKIVKDVIEYIKKRYNEAENASRKNTNEHSSTQENNKDLSEPKGDTDGGNTKQKDESKRQCSLEQHDKDILKECKDVCFNEQDLENIKREPVFSEDLNSTVEEGDLGAIDEKNYDRDIYEYKYVNRNFECFFKQIDTDYVKSWMREGTKY